MSKTMQLNDQEVNHLLDMYNENCELLQEEIISGGISKHTVVHIKSQLARCLENMKTKDYKTIKKDLYDVLQIISM